MDAHMKDTKWPGFMLITSINSLPLVSFLQGTSSRILRPPKCCLKTISTRARGKSKPKLKSALVNLKNIAFDTFFCALS